MMRYIWINIKKKLPLYIICTSLFFVTAFTWISNTTFLKTVFDGEMMWYVSDDTNPGYTMLFVLFMIIMLILPLFGMNYRYSLGRSDLFRQAPYKNKYIRYGEHLSALAIICTAFTLSYIFLVVGLLIKNNFLVKVPEGNEMMHYELIRYHYVYYIPAYFVFLVMGVSQYFISYLFVSRANNFLNSAMLLIAGELFLLFYIFTPIKLYVDKIYGFHQSTLALPIVFVQGLFSKPIVTGSGEAIMLFNTHANRMSAVQDIISLAVYAGLAITGLVAFLMEKDPSSEYAGKARCKGPYQEIIYHLAAFVLGALICGLGQSIIYLFISFFFFMATYYTLYGLLNRNFKLKLYQLIIVISVILLVLLVDVGALIKLGVSSGNPVEIII